MIRSPPRSTPFPSTTLFRSTAFQLAAVNVSDAADTVPSVRSLLEIGITTSATGWLVNWTVNVAVPPASGSEKPPADLPAPVAPAFPLLLPQKTPRFPPDQLR